MIINNMGIQNANLPIVSRKSLYESTIILLEPKDTNREITFPILPLKGEYISSLLALLI